MAEKETKPQEKKTDKKLQSKQQPEQKQKKESFESTETLIRIFGYDIPGSKNLYVGLTRIKGVSWALSNAILLKLNYPRSKKVSELTKDEIQKIETTLKAMPVPDFMKNRRSDYETGKTSHILASDLDVQRDFDIKRMKKIRSYKGIRHAMKLPVRGQRTRSHFRAKGRVAVAVTKRVDAKEK
jgi:small subunit ribosomal protein S13